MMEEQDNKILSELTGSEYKYGFTTDVETEIIPKGLNEEVVRLISAKKGEPEWMLAYRLEAYRRWKTMTMPRWPHLDLPEIDFDDIIYYAAPKAKPKLNSLDEIDPKLKETFDKGGNVVIPSFAVGRTQELLYFIREIKEKELLKEYQNFEVYLDSPLAIEATKIFTKNMRECFDEDALALVNAGINPLIFDGLKTATTSDDSKMINFIEKPKVIISASGMCDAGRIRHHLKHNLWREECTILFVGYQAMGTLGRRLIEGEKNVKLFGEPIEVKARIESLHGISGHADMNGLLKWLGAFKEAPQRVFVVHGEDTVTEEFAKTVEEKFGYQAYAPFPCSEADLLTNEILSEGVKIPVKAKKPAQRKADAAFERLVAAGRRLLDIIYKNEGLANKDKAKFESQINNLSDKWDI